MAFSRVEHVDYSPPSFVSNFKKIGISGSTTSPFVATIPKMPIAAPEISERLFQRQKFLKSVRVATFGLIEPKGNFYSQIWHAYTNAKEQVYKAEWRLNEVLEGSFKGFDLEELVVQTKYGDMKIKNYELLHPISGMPLPGQPIEIYLLERKNRSKDAKVVIDMLELPALSQEEMIRIIKKSGFSFSK